VPTVENFLTNLPEDKEALKAILRSLLLERDNQRQRADELYLENLQLQKELWRYKKVTYGPRADRLSESELAQALLEFAEELEQKPLPAERQAQSVPVLAELRQKLLAWKEQLRPKHPMAEAVNYTLSQWEELTVFTSDGAVPIDNNVSEREMKRVVLNRKNSLFVGNPARRTDRSDPGQLDQQLPPARDGSATLLHATADESPLVAGK
jgi:Transposase IS66 family